MAQHDLLGEILAEADRLRPMWETVTAGIPAWHPRNEGDPDPEPANDPDPEPDPAKDPDPDPDPDPEPASREPNWKAEARKHEARNKKTAKERDELAAKLAEIDNANASETEKAIAKAREEAKAEAASEFEQERREDRLELAVTRQATRGIKLEVDEDGKKAEKTVRFADPDDALVHLERAIARKEIDPDDIFDEDGKIQADGLTAALAELLEAKPHLRASNGDGVQAAAVRRPAGGADAGRGAGRAKSLDEMSPADHLKEIQSR